MIHAQLDAAARGGGTPTRHTGTVNVSVTSAVLTDRLRRTKDSMERTGVEALLLSLGSDLPYLTGYEAMPLERLTMLVVPAEGDPTLVVPRLEAMRVEEHADVFSIIPWDETDDPIGIVAGLVGSTGRIAIGDQTWARFLVELLGALGADRTFVRSVDVMGPLRVIKDQAEIDALAAAGAAADRVAAQLQAGEIELIGRTEAEVSADIAARLIAQGHQRVNFAIVAAGENAASPHHDACDRVIGENEIVLCDFGGARHGYCSDITRCVVTGHAASEITDAYDVLHEAQQAAVAAATTGTPCEEVDATARSIIADAGFGEYFVHRTGHGIGLDAHEDPYIVSGNCSPLEVGHAFSIEPGIYVPGQWGMRLEDIVAITADGPRPLNNADHSLVRL